MIISDVLESPVAEEPPRNVMSTVLLCGEAAKKFGIPGGVSSRILTKGCLAEYENSELRNAFEEFSTARTKHFNGKASDQTLILATQLLFSRIQDIAPEIIAQAKKDSWRSSRIYRASAKLRSAGSSVVEAFQIILG